MAEDKQLLMQLLNMFAQQMGNIGQQRQQGSQFRAQMGAEQQRMAQQRQQAGAGLAQEAAALASLNKFRDAQIKGWQLDWKAEKLQAEVGKEAAEGYQNMIAPKQMPPGPSERYRSATSPPPGMPRGTVEPLYTSLTDIEAELRRQGVSPLAQQRILQGEEGALPIKGQPQPMTPQEIADLKKTLNMATKYGEEAITERERREHPEKYWKPTSTGGGGGGTSEPAAIDMSVFDTTPTGETPAPTEPLPDSPMIAGYSVDALKGVIQEAIDAGMQPNDIVANLMSDILEEVPLADPNTLSAEIGRLVVEMTGTK